MTHQAHQNLRVDQGSMTALELADGSLRGIVALYSIINIRPKRLPGVFAEFHRVLGPGGYLLLAFKSATNPCIWCRPAATRCRSTVTDGRPTGSPSW